MKTLAILVALTSIAAAQSKKYPPAPVDKDKESDEKSRLWESALHPERATYDDIVAATRSAVLSDRRPERVKAAIVELDKAIALDPKRHEAFELRGAAYDVLKDPAKCAKDLEQADAVAPRDPDEPRTEWKKRLGVCQGKAGNFHAAERTLANLTSAGTRDGETWMRLGETRVALGKLDEAITALTFAANDADSINNSQPSARWLLAVAYDRARMPSQAAEALSIAVGRDPAFSYINNPQLGYLGVAESDYMLGLAWGAAGRPSPEKQLAYFLRYLKVAADSPWRRRAEDHVKELRAAQLPDNVETRYGAAVDRTALLTAIRKGMPALRQCLAPTPGLVLTLRVTKSGPRSTATTVQPVRPDPFDARYGRRQPYQPQPVAAGEHAEVELNLMETPASAAEDAKRCVEREAAKLKLPAVTEKDSAYAVDFSIVGP